MPSIEEAYIVVTQHAVQIRKNVRQLCKGDDTACIEDETDDAIVDALFGLMSNMERFPEPMMVINYSIKMGVLERRRQRTRQRSAFKKNGYGERLGRLMYDRPEDCRQMEFWMDTEHNRARAWTALRLMDPYVRNVVYHHIFEGWTLTRIANELGVRTDTVTLRMKRGLARVREIMRYLP